MIVNHDVICNHIISAQEMEEAPGLNGTLTPREVAQAHHRAWGHMTEAAHRYRLRYWGWL